MRFKIICAYCKTAAWKEAGAINRATRTASPMFCTKICFGMSRRSAKTSDQIKEEKRLYDISYRLKNADMIKSRKAEWHSSTYDPNTARMRRKVLMPYHVEYCRKPEYRAKKRVYDQRRRAAEFGDFAESHILLLNLERTLLERGSRYEIDSSKGTLNKKLRRRREYDKAICGKP